MTDHRLYVYALVRDGHPGAPDMPPVGGEGEITVCNLGTLAALVSPYAGDEVLPVRRNVIGHARVLEEAMRHGPLLPMSFGLLVSGADALAGVVRPRFADLSHLLDDLDGCIEVGVRASWIDGPIWREVAVRNPAIAREAARLQALPQTVGYQDRIGIGQRIESIVSAWKRDEAARLQAMLEPFALRQRQLPAAGDLNFINTALLVRADRERSLFDAVAAFEAERPDLLSVKVISPVPPYNFVAVRLDWSSAVPVLPSEAA
jgi:hypothetical protein